MPALPIKLVSGQRPARRIFMDGGRLSWGSEIAVTGASDNVDANSPDRTTILRPGNILLKDTATKIYYDDATTGDPSTQATVTAAVTADASWASKTYTFTVNGVALVTVTSGGADDTDAEIAAVFNANAIFAANLVASVVSNRVVVKTLAVGADMQLLVTSSYATAFGASGTAAHGTDGDWVVVTDWVDQLDGNAVASVQHGIPCVRTGHFDDARLVWGGVEGIATVHQDAIRVLRKRGARFSSMDT